MPTIISAYLGAAFFLSEFALAIWRRAAGGAKTEDHDAGSLRLLWVATSISITAGVLLAMNGVPPRLPAEVPWQTCALVIFLFGAALRWWSIWHLGRFFTVNVAMASDQRVIDNGPYRLVRHPSYSGLILQLFGLGLAFGILPSLVIVVIPPTWALLHRIRIEESALRAHLPSYAGYMARTKKLVPFIY